MMFVSERYIPGVRDRLFEPRLARTSFGPERKGYIRANNQDKLIIIVSTLPIFAKSSTASKVKACEI
jgi:hypothetical protein